MKVGLYFGTFNPVHVGHLLIANYLADYSDLDQVWMVVTPQNPHKQKKSLLEDYHRMAMVRRAIEDNPKLKASDIEFNLPKPSYTSHTLTYIQEKYPDHEFALIMGGDNLRSFHKWMNFEHIIENHQIYVYPRPLTELELDKQAKLGETENDLAKHRNVHIMEDAPSMKLSSSFIRKAVANGKDVRYMLTEPVHQYLTEMNFYK